MKKFLSIIVIALGLSGSLCAALPPYAQTVKEIDAIIHSKELAHYFSSADVIRDISHHESSYTISSDNKKITVDVIYRSERRVGPLEFTLEFHPQE